MEKNYFWERLRDQVWTHYFTYDEARTILTALDNQAKLSEDNKTKILRNELANYFRMEDVTC